MQPAGSQQIHELERVISSVSEDMPLAERLEWLSNSLSWLRKHHTQFSHPQYIFEMLERNPRAKARCARALRSIFREIAAVDFLYDIHARLRPASEIYENDLMLIVGQIFSSEADLIWFSHLDHETVRSFLNLLHHEIAPTERKWNRLNEDVRQALVLLGSEMRITARGWTKLRRQDRIEIFDQTAYARVGLLIDHLIVAKNERQPNESPIIAQELYLLIRQCRRQVDEVRTQISKSGATQEEVLQTEILFQQLSRLKTLINLYTHRSTFARDAIKLLLPLFESYLEDNNAQGSTKSIQRKLNTLQKNSAAMQDDVKARARLRAGFTSDLAGGAVLAAVAVILIGVQNSSLPLMPRVVAQLVTLAFGIMSSSYFNLKYFGELLPTDLGKFGQFVSKVGGLRQGEDQIAYEVAGGFKRRLSSFGLNFIGLIPSVFWVSLIYYVLNHHSLISKDDAIHFATQLSSPISNLIEGLLTGIVLALATFIGVNVQVKMHPSRHPRLRIRKMMNTLRGSAAIIVSSVFFSSFFILSQAVAQVNGLNFGMAHVLMSTAGFVLSVAAAGSALVATKLFWSSLIGLALMGIANLVGVFGTAFLIVYYSQAHRHLSFGVVRKFLEHVRPVPGIVPTRSGVMVPEIPATNVTKKVPDWMVGGGQVKTRGTEFTAQAPLAFADQVTESARLPSVPSAAVDPTEVTDSKGPKPIAMIPQAPSAFPSADVSSADGNDKTEIILHEAAGGERTEIMVKAPLATSSENREHESERTEIVIVTPTVAPSGAPNLAVLPAASAPVDNSPGLSEYGDVADERTEIVSQKKA